MKVRIAALLFLFASALAAKENVEEENKNDEEVQEKAEIELEGKSPAEARADTEERKELGIQFSICISKKANSIDPVNKILTREYILANEELLKKGDSVKTVAALKSDLKTCLEEIGEDATTKEDQNIVKLPPQKTKSKREILNFARSPLARWDKEILYSTSRMNTRSKSQIQKAIADYQAKIPECLSWREVEEAECKTSKNCMIFLPDPKGGDPGSLASHKYFG